MLRGLWKRTWLEIKIFLREPLGAIGSIVFPVFLFVVVGRVLGGRLPGSLAANGFIRTGVPVLAAVMIPLSEVMSLVTIISIYREGGILKRPRATPLRPTRFLRLMCSPSWRSRRSPSPDGARRQALPGHV